MLSAGRFDEVLAASEGFIARVKIYAEGGENVTHSHLTEDHLFFVVGGQATFYLGRDADEVIVVEPYDGVLLPRGAFYHFRSSGDQNLVMLRVGAADDLEDRGRIGADGLPLPGHTAANKWVEGVPIPGRFFPEG